MTFKSEERPTIHRHVTSLELNQHLSHQATTQTKDSFRPVIYRGRAIKRSFSDDLINGIFNILTFSLYGAYQQNQLFHGLNGNTPLHLRKVKDATYNGANLDLITTRDIIVLAKDDKSESLDFLWKQVRSYSTHIVTNKDPFDKTSAHQFDDPMAAKLFAAMDILLSTNKDAFEVLFKTYMENRQVDPNDPNNECYELELDNLNQYTYYIKDLIFLGNVEKKNFIDSTKQFVLKNFRVQMETIYGKPIFERLLVKDEDD